jgi:hypothetical protein
MSTGYEMQKWEGLKGKQSTNGNVSKFPIHQVKDPYDTVWPPVWNIVHLLNWARAARDARSTSAHYVGERQGWEVEFVLLGIRHCWGVP